MRPSRVWPDSIQVRTLRVRGGDAIRSRQRVEAAVGAIEMSPRELLIVRRVAPAVRLKADPGGGSSAFRHAVQLELSHRARTARRPWFQPDAATAESVLFADEAELIACLIRDWLRGSVTERWWWRGVLGDMGVERWLREHALAQGVILVPTLSLLAARGEAARWLTRCGDLEMEVASAAIAEAYDLRLASPEPEPAESGRHERPAGGEVQSASSCAPPYQGFPALERLVATAPEMLAPELGRPQRRLLAVALAVARDPSWARTEHLALALGTLDRASAADLAAIVAGHPTRAKAQIRRSGPPIRREVAALPVRRKATALRPRRSASQRTHPAGAGNPYFAEPADTLVGSTDAAPPPASPRPTRAPLALTPPLLAVDPPTPSAYAAPDEKSIADGVLRANTSFGGIFYLLNAALALELYSDFTAPRGRNLELLPWDWLAMVGRAWFGAEFVHDAVWPVLATLSGRDPGDEPGCYFDPPHEWMVPGAWLAPWGKTEVVLMNATRTRLRLWHPAGFALCDVARDCSERPLAQARKLCANHPDLSAATLLRAHRAGPRSRSPAARWLQWLLGYLRARLARALAIEDVEAVPGVLCRHWARITVSATAVDVSLRLSELPLPIRVAGLDRDPGWIPAAGRSLSFHFA